MVILIVKTLFLVIPLLLSVAYFTIAERKIMGSIQLRKGPNVVGFGGLMQPLADGAKLFFKEIIFSNTIDEILFLFAPIGCLTLSFLIWLVIPFGNGLFYCDFNLGILYIIMISSINVYSLLLAGWSSNSKYAFLGSIRSVSQMVSYELLISFSCLIIILTISSLNLSKIIFLQYYIWYFIPFFSIFIIFFVSILAETNRHPFDLPEAEAELVSGYNIEYSSIIFAQFFLGEYANMLLMSIFVTILFFGGWFFFNFFFIEFLVLGFKINIGVLYFIFSRAIFPRFRYDQLMNLGWTCLLPYLIGYLFFHVGILFLLNGYI